MNLRRFASPAAPLALVLALAAAGPRVSAQAPASQAAVAPAGAPQAPPAPAEHAEAEPEGGHAHHPVVKLFGHSLGTLAQFWVTVFNFILFAGLLVALLKGALSSAFRARARDLEDKLSQAEREKAEAERQVQDLERRMAGLHQELEGILAKAETDAAAEKERILESARAEAEQIRRQTAAEIEARKAQAESELRALVADLAVAGAAKRLESRLQGEVAARVLEQAIDRVGGVQ